MSDTKPKPKPKPTAAPFGSGTWMVDRINLVLHFRRLCRLCARRWVAPLVCSLLGLGGAAYFAWQMPNIYSASSRIGIAPRIQTAFTSQAQYLEELNNFYDSQLQYMSSSKVMARVDEKMRETRPLDPKFRCTTQASKNPGSFSMVVESTDLVYARRFASIWAQEFISFKKELRENAIGRTAASTREEILRCEKNLENARAALLDFQRRNNIGSVKETGDAAQQRLDKLEAEYQDIKTLRQRLETKTSEEIASGSTVEPLPPQPTAAKTPAPNKAQPSDALERFDASSRYGELRLKIITRETERERLGQTLKPKHPFMVKLNQEILQLSEELKFQLVLIEEKRVARIRSLRDDEGSYRPLIDELRKQVLASRNIQYEFERLQEEETSIKKLLENLRKTGESLASTGIDEGAFHVIEEGVGSDQPVRPNRSKTVLAGFVLGLGLGLALVYLLSRLDDRLELAEDIERVLEEPVLGQVPQLQASGGNRPLVTDCREHDLFAESLRGIRSTLLLADEAAPKRVFIVTSAVPGDGKTTLSSNLALTFALTGQRILLVDADLRRGDTHSFFGHGRECGLSDVLTGKLHWSDVLKPTSLPNLQVIHTGQLPPNPGELLVHPIMREFLEEARKAFDYVLIDCPPLTAIDDTFALAPLSDGLLFVVRSGQTSMRFARNALQVLRQRGVAMLGIALNGVSPDNPYYYYKTYYHAYYAPDASVAAQKQAPPSASVKMAVPRAKQDTPLLTAPKPDPTAESSNAAEASNNGDLPRSAAGGGG